MQRIAIIGAGIIGAGLAARLASRARVTLVDTGAPGAGTTASSMAWINANRKVPRHYYELNRAGMRAHAELARRVGSACDWYHRTGTLHWQAPDLGTDDLEDRVARLQAWGYAAQWCTPEQARALEPALRLPAGVDKVAWFPDEAVVDPPALMRYLLTAADTAGVWIRPDSPAVDVEQHGGRVTGVRLAGGELVAADVVVCCAGWRSRELAAGAGIDLGLVPGDAPGSSAPTLLAHIEPRDRAAPQLVRPLYCRHLNARPWPGRRVYLEADDQSADVDLHTPQGEIAQRAEVLLERARRVIPAIAGSAEVAEAKVCVRALPEDGLPLVGFSSAVDGWYTVVTHSGMTLALHLADLVTRELLDGERAATLEPYRPGRDR